jgi:predicted RNA binding protein YcfA (HicA-like mRNA interferase family)
MSRLPTVKPRELVAALERAGFVRHHQKGSHLYPWHDGKRRLTAVPMHSGDVHRGLLRAILKQADVAESAFADLL